VYSSTGYNLTCDDLEDYLIALLEKGYRKIKRAAADIDIDPGDIFPDHEPDDNSKPKEHSDPDLTTFKDSIDRVCDAAKAGIAFGVTAW
jgi:hypothetical protein